jgi:ribokinase
VLKHVDYLTPNETELRILSGMPAASDEEVEAAALSLVARGAKHVVVKLGARGAMYVSGQEMLHVPAFAVKAVDTTAAGDAFNAGFACALSEGADAAAAVCLGNAAGALATTGYGAQSALPDREKIRTFMASAGF